MNVKIYKIFIISAFDGFEKYYFIGTKEQLMALIGILYSTRLVQIEGISYQILKEAPDDCKQIKYAVESNGNIFTYVCKGENKKECSTCKSDNSHENCLGCIEYGHWELKGENK